MATWFTARPCAPASRSHINVCVFDSTWEASEAFTLDTDSHVDAWVKNDHLGFEVHYVYQGAVRRYRPDFLVRLNEVVLVLEVKGQDNAQQRTKRAAMVAWCEAVNAHGGVGRWVCDVSFKPSDLHSLLAKHASS